MCVDSSSDAVSVYIAKSRFPEEQTEINHTIRRTGGAIHYMEGSCDLTSVTRGDKVFAQAVVDMAFTQRHVQSGATT